MNSEQIVNIPTLELTGSDHARMRLAELVGKGYGFNDEPGYYAFQAQQEYEGTAGREVFLYVSDGRAAGSIVFSVRDSTDRINQKFWGAALEGNPLLTDKLGDNVPVTCGIHGVVVHPEFRRLQIAHQLLASGVEKIKPVVVSGRTKTPELLPTLTKTLGPLGFRTFYGAHEITSEGQSGPTREHQNFINAYFATHNYVLDSWGVSYAGVDVLLPYVPDVSRLPGYMQEAFANVIAAQIEAGNEKTPVQQFLCIKSEYLLS